MREFPTPDHRVDTTTLDTFLSHEAEELYQFLRPVTSDAFYGISNPNLARVPRGYYESLLANDINRPSNAGDQVAEPLVVSLTSRGLEVFPAELPYDHLGAYNGSSIVYRDELAGILRASVIAHEAAHYFAGHTPEEAREDGQEAIAESAAMLALRALGIDTSSISLPDIARYIARTASTNGFLLWNPHQEGLQIGLRQAKAAAKQIVLAVEAGRAPYGLR